MGLHRASRRCIIVEPNMRRRIVYIIVAIIVIAALAFAAYWFFFRNQGAPVPAGGTTGSLPSVGTQGGSSASETAGGSTGGTAGTAGTGNTVVGAGNIGVFSPGNAPNTASPFGLISNEPTLAYFDDAQNNVTIVEPSGKIASILNGQPTFLNSTAIQDVISAGFSHDGTKVVVSFGDPTNPQTSIFTVATKSWTPLPGGIISPVWSPVDGRIAYLTENSGGGETLSSLDTANAKAKPVSLATLHLADVTIAWPSSNQIVIADKPSSYESGSVLLFNIAKRTVDQPFGGGAGLDTVWSNNTSSDALVFTAGAAEHGGTLALWNPAVGSMQNLVFLTLPSKCIFNNETGSSSAPAGSASSTLVSTSTAPMPYTAFYCGIPQDQNVLAGQALPDAYDQMALFTTDSFFKVRADNGATQNLYTPPIAVDATNLHVFNNILFMINRYDQKLYALSLGGS